MTAWKTVPLGEVADFVRGINFKPEDVVPVGAPGSVGCLRTSNVQSEVDLSDVWGVSESFVRRPEQILRYGDILISSANSWNLVGKCCWIPKLPWRASFGGFVSVLRADVARVEPRFLYRWFSSTRIQATLRSFGRQTTNISNLNIDRCLGLDLPLPPLPEQRRIAAILDKADDLRAKRRAALAQLDGLAQSVFVDVFGDPVFNPKRWPVKSLGEIGSVVTGNTPSRERPEFYGDAIEWIKSDNINTSAVVLTRAAERLSKAGKEVARTVPAGSVLVTCIAGSPSCIGNAAIADREVAFNQQINGLVPNECCDVFFLYCQFVLAKRLVQLASTGGMKGLVSKSRFEAVKFIVPPVELQKTFGCSFMRIQRVQASQGVSFGQLEDLFASLQHRAFAREL